MNNRRFLISLILAGASGQALASGVTAADLEEVVVTAGRIVLAGTPRAAALPRTFGADRGQQRACAGLDAG